MSIAQVVARRTFCGLCRGEGHITSREIPYDSYSLRDLIRCKKDGTYRGILGLMLTRTSFRADRAEGTWFESTLAD